MSDKYLQASIVQLVVSGLQLKEPCSTVYNKYFYKDDKCITDCKADFIINCVAYVENDKIDWDLVSYLTSNELDIIGFISLMDLKKIVCAYLEPIIPKFEIWIPSPPRYLIVNGPDRGKFLDDLPETSES